MAFLTNMTFEDFLKEWRDDSHSIVANTSGSTGTPKKISLSKKFMEASASRTNSFFGINRGSRLHSCVSPDFIGGKMMAVRSEIAGCCLTWEIPSNRPLTDVKKDEKIDLLAVVPSQMLHILDYIGDMPQIGAVIIGGSAIPEGLKLKIINSGMNAYETYGMTETSSHIALRRVGGEWFEALQGIEVSTDHRGCLSIEIPYTDENEEYSSVRITTNDIAELHNSSRFKILGRIDNVIITGGRKVNPEDVERRLSSMIKGNFQISSFPDEKWGRRVVLVVDKDVKYEEETLKNGLRSILQPWEIPKEIIITDHFEFTPNGKIKRNSTLST